MGGRVTAKRPMARWRWGLILAVLSAGCIVPALAWANLPSFPNPNIVMFRSIGGVFLGDSYSAAHKAWGPATGGGDNHCSPKGGCTYDDGNKGEAVFDLNNSGKVATLLISVGGGSTGEPDYSVNTPLDKLQTRKGIHLGSSLKALKHAYPQGRVKPPQGPGSDYYYLLAPDGKSNMAFGIYKRHVAYIDLSQGKG
jgi:hypothetical protein